MLNEKLSSYIQTLEIENFRNHKSLSLKSDAKFMLLLGDNGKGKTNILESVSLFANGRGMRNAKSEDILNNNISCHEWVVRLVCENTGDISKLLMAAKLRINQLNMKKILKINDEVKQQKKVAEILKVIWLTPQMENLFLESQSVQRKFIDRMTYNFLPGHAKLINEYDYYLKSRSKAMLEGSRDANFLACIEGKIAVLSIGIVQNRQACLNKINLCLQKLSLAYLQPKLSLRGFVEDCLQERTTAEAELLLQEKLLANREVDSLAKRCSAGAHKSELEVFEREMGRKARHCSTGEQKSMLISLIIGQSYALYEDTKIAPILLLDEVFSHLDEHRKRQLVEELGRTPSQIWVSSTDKNLGEMINDAKTFFCV
jgi:DNA replication and repair protein RecF